MFFTKQDTRDKSFDTIFHFLHFIRPHQLIYQITLVTVILFFTPTITSFQLFSAFLMIVLITPTFLLVQDLLGKKDDEKAGQRRILFSEQINKIFFICSVSLMVLILFLNSIFSLLSYGCLFLCTLSYAATKHFHKMYSAYLFRYFSSIFTFLLYFFILLNYFTVNLFILLILISVLDLVGNIAGDIRDERKDCAAGVLTLVTTKGKPYTKEIMSLSVLLVFGLLSLYYNSLVFVLLLIFNLIPFLVIDQLPVRLAHGVFHLSKIVNFLIIAFFLSYTNLLFFLGIFLFIIGGWTLSYYFYLYYLNSYNKILSMD